MEKEQNHWRKLFSSSENAIWCTFQILGGCQGRRTGVVVTTVSSSLISGGWVTKILRKATKIKGVEGWVTTRF